MKSSKRLSVMLVAGARPNFMKISAIIDALKEFNRSNSRPIDFQLVHTGQHYDQHMSQSFFQDLGMPKPDVDLEVGSGSHAQQTAEIMRRIEPVLLKTQPNVVLVVGDVNSTIACALVASKIVYPQSHSRLGASRPLIAHVEAGLRSFDWEMPEEVNRVLTDRLSDMLFTTEETAKQHLRNEGIAAKKIFFVGNTMVDTLLKHREKAMQSPVLQTLGLGVPLNHATRSRKKIIAQSVQSYAVLTLHRPSNVDQPKTLKPILNALKFISKDLPVVFPAHPRTRARLIDFGFQRYFANPLDGSQVEVGRSGLYCVDPLSYLDFLCLTAHARLVLTDSGGIQEETTILGVPCVTIRENTERPITVRQGTNVLAGVSTQSIIAHAAQQLRSRPKRVKPKYWDGKAGARIVNILSERVRG
ncbi:MAG: UDP-N-acetylglucosamine 2-epimerase (non-hydrolyzing) [Nitrospirota bacterium]|nr:UDP-N-acetylglucosamine 2-epimerase (non-hydrolyzing) [Nitrospirota bacterium]